MTENPYQSPEAERLSVTAPGKRPIPLWRRFLSYVILALAFFPTAIVVIVAAYSLISPSAPELTGSVGLGVLVWAIIAVALFSLSYWVRR